VLAKASLNLDSIRSRAFKQYRKSEDPDGGKALDTLRRANTVMAIARQLLVAAKRLTDHPSPEVGGAPFYISTASAHLTHIENALSQYAMLMTSEDSPVADKSIQCEQIKALARSAMKHWEG
jgi:hypothetical protein